MKTTFLALCLFLFAYGATSSIVDTDGHPVRNAGGSYDLIAVSNELNGGLGLASVGDEANPKAVVLDPENSPDLPVRFECPYRRLYISSSLSLNIRFVSSSSDQGIWDVSPEFPIGWTVRVSNTESFIRPFRVESAKRGFKIVYYPGRGETGRDLGLVYSDGRYRLSVKDGEPFIFKIKKATGENSSGIMSIV